MKVKRKYFKTEYIIFQVIFISIYFKLIFSYLLVKPSYWIRYLPVNAEAYNFLNMPEDISTKIELVLVPILFFYNTYYFKLHKKFIYTYLICCGLLLLNCITSLLTNISIVNSITTTLKVISPILFFLTLMILNEKGGVNIKKTIKKTINFCVVLVITGIVFLEISMNRMVAQWPIYFSNIHTHTYILVCCFIFYSYLLYRKGYKVVLILFFSLSFLVLLIGYDVRTAILFYALYSSMILFLIHDFFKYLWIKAIVFLPLIFGIAIFFINADSADSISSGRLTMYAAKYELLKSYSFTELMFGRGYGSDLIRTEEWWYAEKNSHSDIITFVVENGFFYLMGFIVLIITLLGNLKNNNLIFLSLVLGYLVTSSISNGIAVRPLAAYIFFAVLFYIYNTDKDSSLKKTY